MNVQDIIFPIGDLIVWTFDNVLVPIGNVAGRTFWELLWASVGIFGIALWLRLQAKYNREAASNPDQIK